MVGNGEDGLHVETIRSKSKTESKKNDSGSVRMSSGGEEKLDVHPFEYCSVEEPQNQEQEK